MLEPLIHGGKSTTIYRSGTPYLPLIVSMAKALRLAYDNIDSKYNKVLELNLKGIRTELTFERINNYGDLLSNIIGTTGFIPVEEIDEYESLGYKKDDIVGTSYLEKYYETATAWSYTFLGIAILILLISIYHYFSLPKISSDKAIRNGNELNTFIHTFISFFQKKQIG